VITYKKYLHKLCRYFFVLLGGSLGLLLPTTTSYASFEYSEQYKKALHEILSLRLENGRAIINQAKITEPNNSLFYLAEDYIDFFTILINEDQAEYEKLLKNKSLRISEIEKDDKNSPWYNYCKAEIYMHWATNRIRFGNYIKAAREIKEAYNLLEANIKKYPHFLPNNKTMGMLETLVGTVPSNYQWVVSIVGMEGNIEHGMQSLPQPIMLYYYGPFFRHDKPQKGRLRELRQFGIEIMGTEKSIADALVIRTTATILKEAGAQNLMIEVNSIGDKECRQEYIRELTTYYRKHINEICTDCKNRIKVNPMRLLDCIQKECQPIKEGAPDSISSLCTNCKTHFKEVLEYLEEMDLPYHINKNLVRGLNYYTRTVFEITEQPLEEEESPEAEEDKEKGKGKETAPEKKEGEPKEEAPPILSIASGGRYDYLARGLGSRKDVPSVGAAIGVDRVIMSEWSKKLAPRIFRKPKVYFIRLGTEAKMKSFKIIEILRQGRVPLAQSISKDSISTQLSMA